jgi:type IV secretion system protein VirD4
MPEEDSSKYFMVSLLIQQLYREILAVADENGGKLKNRVVFYCDEFGTLPKIESAEMMFSASRSRRVSIVPIIQSFAQLEKNYGDEGAEIIIDNTQLTVFGGFAPNSESAEKLSKAMGSRTVQSGSVSQSKNDPSRSLQMIERPLMTPDELKSLPKGTFIVTKTGFYPIKVKLKLFFKWGIEFEKEPYVVPLRDNSRIQYADKQRLQESIENKYPKHRETDGDPESDLPSNATRINQDMTENNFNPQKKEDGSDDKEGGGENSFQIKMSKRQTGGE